MTQLLQNALFGTALILAAVLLRRAMGERLLPAARLALWAVCLVRLLAPVFPASGLSLWGLAGTAAGAAPDWNPAPLPGGELGNVPAVNAPAGTAVPAPQPVEPAAFPWEAVVPAVWIGVGLVLAARYVWSWNRTRRAVAQAVPLGRDDPRYGLLPRCARLREGVMDGAPLTFGAARPTVVVPPELDGGALECVLVHEAVHARRRDNLWHYGMAAALIVYWWNPAVWLMSRLLRRDIELACDRAAVKRLGAARRAEYAQTLVALATASDGPAFCQTFGRKAAEERIISVMKFKKTTIFGVVLSLVLVAGVTAAFASAPKAPDEDSTTSTAPAIGIQSVQLDAESGNVTEYTVNLDVLKQNLDRHVAEGTMTQTEADRVWAQAQEFAQGGKALTWSFQGDSGLTLDELHKVCYRDENGNLIPVDPATVASGFIFPAADTVTYHGRSYNRADLSAETLEWLDWYLALSEEERLAVSYEPAELRGGEVFAAAKGEPADTVTYHGRSYNRADLSAETLLWLESYLALSEEEQLAVSYEPAELRGGELPTTEDAGQPGGDEAPAGEQGLTHDPNGTKDSAGAGICTDESCPVSGEHHHEGDTVVHHYDTQPLEIPVCPVEGCTAWGTHTHDGATYLCSGGHCGGVCDGSCAAGVPSGGRHHGAGNGNGHHGGHH
ncbi:MAG: M56 family metallopeptidase [Oscillospiraceae bacterium]|jgi:beta-lactamase regulating signal transducer with metallopeptidase domain|nr:M56 family metallopeptidase [Oscillospiraceae bacterium]